ncbi:hypothetical protein GGE49_003084 [Agrobacterium tumefaciens]|uniref:Uncharacterized protein n=1 Tax=Agrobacterium radiobacter TaxID=362 RepID=A0ABR6J7I2_AGRRD|nr:hypothetical protein [Agrobacterium radiobacter]MBB4490872.1 hypothetical protein [Agrobacterium radiobacter]MBB4556528.1 hypothetical protein [Agrobacterium radiobacter]
MTEETFSDFAITLGPMTWAGWFPVQVRNGGNEKSPGVRQMPRLCVGRKSFASHFSTPAN